MPRRDGYFKKGNPGRPKGVKNKVTKTLRSMIGDFLSERWPSIEKEFKGKGLKPRDRIILYERLLNYALPKYQNFTLEGMNEQDLERYEEFLKERYGFGNTARDHEE